MKQITYKNKKLKLPYELTEGEATADGDNKNQPVQRPVNTLPGFAAAVYDYTMYRKS